MLRTRLKSDYLKNKYFIWINIKIVAWCAAYKNVLLCPDMVVNDFELIRTKHLNAKLKTVKP